jgi:hypothetical protein
MPAKPGLESSRILGVIAMISCLCPLAIIREGSAEGVNTGQFKTVLVSSFEDDALTADRKALIEAFDERVNTSPAFDPACSRQMSSGS